MKKLYKVLMFFTGIIIAGLSLIPLSAQAVVCLENRNPGADVRGTYAGVPKVLPATIIISKCVQWPYTQGAYMMLETSFLSPWGHRHDTRALNDGERVVIGGGTVWGYDWAIYSGQCVPGDCPE